MTNASALFRSLLVYGICLPLAVFLGYLLANPLDFETLTVVVVIFSVLAIPLLLRWHHAWLIACWNTTAVIFFLPGRPALWTGLAAASFIISILQYTLNRRMKFLHAPSLVWPLIFLTVVILLTARLTGGFGTKLAGGNTYGGKRYFTMLMGVIGFLAIINRRIPPKRAGLYVTLFFLGSATWVISNLPGVVGGPLNFLFVVFPVESLSAFTEQNSVVGHTSAMGRVSGLAFLGTGVFCAMLARYGLRGILDSSKPWRLGVFFGFAAVGLLSGFRGDLIVILMTLAFLFYLERLHHTRLLLPVVIMVLAGGGLATVFASRLPLPIQRTLTVIPFIPVDPTARLDAEYSSEWRKAMWREVLPQIPQHLILGKGFTFSAAEQSEIMGRDVESFELVSDYHNGPLSVILPLGLPGVFAFVWLVIAGIRAVYQNYRFGDPAYQHMNRLLFAYFLVKVVFFFTVFGSIYSDLPTLLGLLGLSVSLNGGVARPVLAPAPPEVVFNRFKLHPSVRRPVSA